MRQPRTVHATFLLVALLAATAATGQSRPGGSPAGEQERNSARAAATSEEVARQLTDEQMKGYVQFLRSYQPANAAPGSDPRAAMRAAAEQARLTEQQVAGITLLVREFRSARDGGSAFRARYGDRAADLIARNLPAIDAAAAAGGPSGPPPRAPGPRPGEPTVTTPVRTLGSIALLVALGLPGVATAQGTADCARLWKGFSGFKDDWNQLKKDLPADLKKPYPRPPRFDFACLGHEAWKARDDAQNRDLEAYKRGFLARERKVAEDLFGAARAFALACSGRDSRASSAEAGVLGPDVAAYFDKRLDAIIRAFLREDLEVPYRAKPLIDAATAMDRQIQLLGGRSDGFQQRIVPLVTTLVDAQLGLVRDRHQIGITPRIAASMLRELALLGVQDPRFDAAGLAGLWRYEIDVMVQARVEAPAGERAGQSWADGAAFQVLVQDGVLTTRYTPDRIRMKEEDSTTGMIHSSTAPTSAVAIELEVEPCEGDPVVRLLLARFAPRIVSSESERLMSMQGIARSATLHDVQGWLFQRPIDEMFFRQGGNVLVDEGFGHSARDADDFEQQVWMQLKVRHAPKAPRSTAARP